MRVLTEEKNTLPWIRQALRSRLLLLLATAVPIGNGCDSSKTTNQPVPPPQTCFTNADLQPQPTKSDITYTRCNISMDVPDAGSGGLTDAGTSDGGSIDAGLPTPPDLREPAPCFQSCWDACKNNPGPGFFQGCQDVSVTGAQAKATCTFGYMCGRRPDGLVDLAPMGDGVAAWFAQAAWLEAASIYSFTRLAQELEMFGAPGALVEAAHRARQDEIRHARTMAQLAHHCQATVPRVQVVPAGSRSLEDVAAENIVEGCVGETFGALLALHQARCASTKELRQIFAAIANDELEHAALAWAVSAWAEVIMDESARCRVHAAREKALERLRAQCSESESLQRVAELGLPEREQLLAFVAALENDPWCAGHHPEAPRNPGSSRSRVGVVEVGLTWRASAA